MAELALVCRGYRKNGQSCGNILGLVTDGKLSVQHHGRAIRGLDMPLPDGITITCEDCGTPWRPGIPLESATDAIMARRQRR